MNAGLPGTGIGGIFYILGALLMLLVEAVRVLKRERGSGLWKKVSEQVGIALGIVGSYWLIGFILSKIFVEKTGVLLPIMTAETNQSHYNVAIWISPFIFLTSVLVMSWAASLLLKAFKKVRLS